MDSWFSSVVSFMVLSVFSYCDTSLGKGPKQAEWSSGSNRLASRLLQFLCSFLQVPVNGTPDEFCHRSARLLRQLHQLLELFFLQEESRPLHGHTVPYR